MACFDFMPSDSADIGPSPLIMNLIQLMQMSAKNIYANILF